MTRQRAGPQGGDPLFESAGCCGLLAYIVGAGLLVVALAALGFVLVAGLPDRWQGIADPSAHPLALITDPRHPQTVYVATEQGRILISRDGGQSWRESHQGLPPATPISTLAVLPGGTGAIQLLAGTSKGAYRSSDGGTTWRSAGPGLPFPTIVDAVAALPDGTLLAGTTASGVYVLSAGATRWMPATAGLPRQSDIYAFLPLAQSGHVLAALISGGIYASQDSGLTWAESDQGLSGASGVNVFSLLALPDPRRAGESIVAGTSRGLYVSHDQGMTWAPSSAGIGTTRVISLTRDPVTPMDVFAGTDTGVYASRDGGATWHAVGFGLPAEQHVGAIGVVHVAGGEQVILASVDQLYRYPGQWPLASQPWRALGFAALILLALTLVAEVVWWVRGVLTT